MNKFFLLGIVSLAGLLALFFFSNGIITGLLIEESIEDFDLGENLMPQAPRQYPEFELIPLKGAKQSTGLLPTKDWLAPENLNFEINNIPIIESNYYGIIPVFKDRINVYSGSAGYYEEDPREYLHAYLCAYAYKVQGAPIRCEEVPLNYFEDKIVFARGYAEDEYIAYQAVGTNFAAFIALTNPEYGILATSPVAYVRIID